MDESACRRFFTNPNQTHHRRYEALRAVGNFSVLASGRFVLGHERSPSDATKRHQFHDIFRRPELRSVIFPAASCAGAVTSEDDAPDVSLKKHEVQSACFTDAEKPACIGPSVEILNSAQFQFDFPRKTKPLIACQNGRLFKNRGSPSDQQPIGAERLAVIKPRGDHGEILAFQKCCSVVFLP